MKYRSRPLLCAFGMVALLSSCQPTAAPSSTPAPVQSTAPPVQTATPMASATPGASLTPAATPAVSGTPNGTATPSTSGSPSASGNVPQVPGVKITVKKPGSGEPIAAGVNGSFHYTGWLDGYESVKKFDSSKDRNVPFDVALGKGMVIPGWDQGLIGMQPGEIRRLEISPEMGYGANGSPPVIPPNATLFFEVEYLGPAK